MLMPFQWSGNTGGIKSPAQVERERQFAEALLAPRGVAQNGWEGLSHLTSALSGTALRNQANADETAARERAAALLSGIGSGSSPDAIIAALTNPDAAWLSPGQSSIASALLSQGLERSDPRYQQQMALGDLELRQREAELQAQLNPPPPAPDYGFTFAPDGTLIRTDTTSGVFEPMGSFPKPESGPLVTVNNGGEGTDIGTIPPGYAAVVDPTNPAGFRFEAIPGGPVAAEQAAAEQTAANSAGQRDTATTIITGAADAARQAFNSGAVTTGIVGNVAAINPESQAAELRRQIDVLKSNASIENLTAMRQASPTGGALGSVTERENAMLASKTGALDPSSPNFMQQLDDYERTLLEIVHGPEAGRRIFDETRASSGEGDATDARYSADQPPSDWTGNPADWKYLTPESRALWP